MLILKRKRGESVVMVHGLIIVKVLKQRPHGEIWLGFEAPCYVPIDRKEIYEKKKKQQAEKHLYDALSHQVHKDKHDAVSENEESYSDE